MSKQEEQHRKIIRPRIPPSGYLTGKFDFRSRGITHVPKFGQPEKVFELDLDLNNIEVFPNTITHLVNLRVLYLSNNMISEIPIEIKRLQNLSILNLQHNNISTLPKEIRNLTSLKRLDLRDNPLPLPPEILEKVDHPQTIIEYYFSSMVTAKRSISEAKVLVVGQGAVGKTSLILQILQGIFNHYQSKTEGISISQWKIHGWWS